MNIGTAVEWRNESFIVETYGQGLVVAIHDTYVVIERPDMMERYPHLNPFITKRIWEVQVVEQRAAA